MCLTTELWKEKGKVWKLIQLETKKKVKSGINVKKGKKKKRGGQK